MVVSLVTSAPQRGAIALAMQPPAVEAKGDMPLAKAA
jgi:hypothetical protein